MNFLLIRNFLSLAGAETFAKLVTFAAFAYLARIYGPAGFGYIEWAAAVLMCASLIVDQGFSAYGAREIAKHPDETGRLTAEVVTARLLLALISYALVVVFAVFFVEKLFVRQLLLVYGLSLFALPFLLQWVFQGHDRMNLVAITQILRQTVFVGIVFGFVRAADDLLIVGIAEVLAVSITAAVCIVIFRRIFSDVSRLRPRLSLKIFREGVPIGLSQMFWVVKMFGATLIVGLVATAEDTGQFAGAMRIFIAVHTFVWLYYFNLLPSFSRAWTEGPEKLYAIIKNSMRIVLAGSAVAVLIGVFSAPYVMTLVYGESFLPGSGALQWLGGACAAAAISGHYRFGLIASGFQTREMLTTAAGAISAVALIPVGYVNWGTSGAAAALCFGEILILLISWMVARRTLFVGHAEGLELNHDSVDGIPEATK